MEEEEGRKDVVPVFYPTMDDMRGSFERYIESIEDQFAAAGICKIVPPKAWSPRKESCVPHAPLPPHLFPPAVSLAPLCLSGMFRPWARASERTRDVRVHLLTVPVYEPL